MNQLLRFGLILGVICLAATLVLAVTYEITKPKIEEKLKIEEEGALKEILPNADSFNEKRIDGIDYFEAKKDKNLAGYCLKVTGAGYNGFIRIIVGIDPSGTIKGVRILEQQETPGLGAKVGEEAFLKQFAGKEARGLEVKKNIDAVTGATISSRAVTDAINKTVSEFLAKRK